MSTRKSAREPEGVQPAGALHYGGIDLALIAKLYGKPEEQVIAELGDLIFHDPESKTWQTADEYLSALGLRRRGIG